MAAVSISSLYMLSIAVYPALWLFLHLSNFREAPEEFKYEDDEDSNDEDYRGNEYPDVRIFLVSKPINIWWIRTGSQPLWKIMYGHVLNSVFTNIKMYNHNIKTSF